MGLDMFNKYDNLPSDYIPNNEWRFAKMKEEEVIVPGSTCFHVCELPFWFSDLAIQVAEIEAIYNQGLDLKAVLRYSQGDITIYETEDLEWNKKTFVHISLNESITSSFNFYNQCCYLQLKIILEDGSISYERKIPIRIEPTTDITLQEVKY